MDAVDLANRHRVTDGSKFSLDAVDPYDTFGLDLQKADAKARLEANMKNLRRLQERLYAEGRRAVLVILQAMDAAGKDSAIEHVMSGINPQGCDVRAFKAPGPIELKHDFLWRHAVALPMHGRIGIFNRSHYEEVLVVRVHPELLQSEELAEKPEIWKHRFKSIRMFEKHLVRNGTTVVKFFLHISKEEQARRLVARIDDPDKNWKFSFGDVKERESWPAYMAADEDMIRNTARDYSPWYVVPSNDKWYSRLVISATIAETLRGLDPQFPAVSEEDRQRMLATRAALAEEAGATMDAPATTG